MKSNLILIAVGIIVFVTLLFARRELLSMLEK